MKMSDKMCPGCNKNPAQEPHPCPFCADVNNDTERLCECCEECELDCALDI